MDPVRMRRRGVAMTSFAFFYPQWMELAAEVLFRNDKLRDEENYDIQNAVAEALKLAWEMGRDGREPPNPPYAPRRYIRPPDDPEIERIYHELKMLAWSPKSGSPAPPGYLKWSVERKLAASKKEQQQTPPQVVRRRAVEPTTPSTPTIVRRRK